MAVNSSLRKLRFETAQQLHESLTLCGGSRVFRGFAISSAAADVANTDTVGVLPFAMRTLLGKVAPLVYAAITIDHEVVADGAPSSGLMPSRDVSHGDVLALGSCGAMDDDFVYCSHRLLVYGCHPLLDSPVIDGIKFLIQSR